MKKLISIVEDDENVAEGLREVLLRYDYRVMVCQTIAQTLELLEREPVDLMILDVHLKKESGYTLCEKIRESYDFPVLFLTGCSSETELLQGFQSGGDDYVVKPFRINELLVRIQALLRRNTSNPKESFLKSGEVVFHTHMQQVQCRERVLELTATERKLVKLLMKNWPRTLPREELLYQVWDRRNHYVEANTLNVNMSRLRDKLGLFEGKPYIETVRGIGYRWAVPVRK